MNIAGDERVSCCAPPRLHRSGSAPDHNDKKIRQGDQPSGGETTWTNTGATVAPLNVKTTLNVKTAKCEKPNNR